MTDSDRVTVLANIRVNTPERLQHLKDSFDSFSWISDNWLINVRGAYRSESLTYLRERLGGRGQFFELLDDSRGWIRNALDMLRHARYSYVLIWNEDHINTAPRDFVEHLIQELIERNVDYLHYAHFTHWRTRIDANLQSPFVHRGTYIDYARLTKANLHLFFPRPERACIVSSPAIFRKTYLEHVMRLERNKFPMWVTDTLYRFMTLLNRLGWRFDQRHGYDLVGKWFFYTLRRFDAKTPFELEITQDRTYILPLTVASPKRELFACIDDEIDAKDHNGSLISRGLYPLQERLIRYDLSMPPAGCERSVLALKENEHRVGRYVFYDKHKQVRASVLREYISVIRGRVRVVVGDEQLDLNSGEGAGYFTNITHDMVALEPSEIVLFTPKPDLARHTFVA